MVPPLRVAGSFLTKRGKARRDACGCTPCGSPRSRRPPRRTPGRPKALHRVRVRHGPRGLLAAAEQRAPGVAVLQPHCAARRARRRPRRARAAAPRGGGAAAPAPGRTHRALTPPCVRGGHTGRVDRQCVGVAIHGAARSAAPVVRLTRWPRPRCAARGGSAAAAARPLAALPSLRLRWRRPLRATPPVRPRRRRARSQRRAALLSRRG
jgi:hypothetical protein